MPDGPQYLVKYFVRRQNQILGFNDGFWQVPVKTILKIALALKLGWISPASAASFEAV